MSSPVVLALDFGGSKIAATVADTRGARLATATVPTAPRAGATVNFDLGVATARRLLAGAGRELAAVAASSFGNPFEDRVELALAIEGWAELALGRELRTAFPGVPLRMANDVKAAALAESSSGALAGCDPAIYLNLGTGIAVAVIVGGAVLTGANGAAGEIGYSLRRAEDVVDPAPVTLEQAVGGGALDRRAAHAGLGSAAGLFGAAGPTVDEIAREIAVALVNMTVLVDPVRIAVGGGMTRSWERLAPSLVQALAAHTPFPPELVLARHPHEAPLLGALTLALAAAADSAGRDGADAPAAVHAPQQRHRSTPTIAASRP